MLIDDSVEMMLAKAVVKDRPTEELEALISITKDLDNGWLGLPIIEAAKQELLNRSEETILGEET